MTRRSKYRARKTTVGGIKFDSQAEATRYTVLRHMQRVGEISDLQLQVRFPLLAGDVPLRIVSEGYPKGRAVSYVADFVYTENGQRIIEDVKGVKTQLYKLKKAIMASMGYQIREHQGRR